MATTKLHSKKKVAQKASSKAAPKRVTKKHKQSTARMRSFKLAKQQAPFLSFSPSIQTFYWIIIGLAVIASAGWTLKQQADIQMLYDEIDMINTQQLLLDDPIKSAE